MPPTLPTELRHLQILIDSQFNCIYNCLKKQPIVTNFAVWNMHFNIHFIRSRFQYLGCPIWGRVHFNWVSFSTFLSVSVFWALFFCIHLVVSYLGSIFIFSDANEKTVLFLIDVITFGLAYCFMWHSSVGSSIVTDAKRYRDRSWVG